MKKSPVKKSAAPSAMKKTGSETTKKSSAKKPAVKTVKAAVPAKKVAPVAKKAAVPAKKAAPVAKKAAVPAKKVAPVAKKAAVPGKKAAPVAKKAAVPAKKVAPVAKKAAAPAKKAAPVEKKAAAPAKKVATVAKKAAAPAKKVAPVTKKAAVPASASEKTVAFEKAPRHKKLKMTKAQKKHYTALLMELRAGFASRLRSHQEDALSSKRDSAGERAGMATHMADLGSDNFRHDLELGLMTEEGDVLEMIDEALQKIEDSEYGICVDCECPINPERLEAKPYARYCIRCKDRREKMEDPQRRHR